MILEFRLCFAVRCVQVSVCATLLIDLVKKLSILLHSMINFSLKKRFFSQLKIVAAKGYCTWSPLKYVDKVLTKLNGASKRLSEWKMFIHLFRANLKKMFMRFKFIFSRVKTVSHSTGEITCDIYAFTSARIKHTNITEKCNSLSFFLMIKCFT